MIARTHHDRTALFESGAITALVLSELIERAQAGVETEFLDRFARKRISELGATPSFLNYRSDKNRKPYPAAICACINDETVHALPSQRALRQGDILSIDIGINYCDYFTDAATTIAIGKVSPNAEKLMDVTRKALAAGIGRAQVDGYVGDIGEAIEEVVIKSGFSVVRSLTGHGVGKNVHEEPYIHNYGRRGEGERLREGMVIAIEPIVSAGDGSIMSGKDGFSYITRDGKLSAHEEHTILLTRDGPQIVTIYAYPRD